jgi:hypothetical protein
MLLSSLKKIGCKHLIGAMDFCKGGVSQLNGVGYNPRGGRTRHIY